MTPKTINRKNLSDYLAKRAKELDISLTQIHANILMDELWNYILEQLLEGNKITIRNVLSLFSYVRKPTRTHNPRNPGHYFEIPAERRYRVELADKHKERSRQVGTDALE